MKSKFLYFVLILSITGCSPNFEENIPYVPVQEVKITNVQTDKIYQGYIERMYDSELSFNLSGVLTGKYISNGEFVKKGALLAKIDNDEYQFQIKKTKAELEEARIKQNRANSYYKRISKLYQAGGISYNDWEEAKTNLNSSEKQIEVLENSLKINQKQENFTRLYAPYDGYIINVDGELGEYIQAGKTVIYFQGNKNPQAKIFVSEKDINNIKNGEKAEILCGATGDKKYAGKVLNRVNSALNKGSFEVTILIEGKNPELLDGMSASVKIGENASKKEILIPITSIVNEGVGSFVYLLKKENEFEGKAIKKEVKTGEIQGENIEIKEGLNGGELLIIKGVNKIMDNSKVKYL